MSKKALLCKPVFFDVTYSINPWMIPGSVDKNKAMTQWEALKSLLERLGVDVRLIEQDPDLPDMVFTANAGTVRGDDVVISNFKHKERRRESEVFSKWFQENSYTVHKIPKSLSFEGCGDTIVSNNKLIAGYGFRSSLKSLKICADILDLDLTYLKLKDKDFYHLDTCFCLLNDNLAIYYPGAFSEYAISKLKDIELIPVNSYNAKMFSCNSVVFDNNVLMPYGNNKVANILKSRGFNVFQLDTSEFIKSGGSLQCMVLWI